MKRTTMGQGSAATNQNESVLHSHKYTQTRNQGTSLYDINSYHGNEETERKSPYLLAGASQVEYSLPTIINTDTDPRGRQSRA